jgi:hypothetical protein
MINRKCKRSFTSAKKVYYFLPQMSKFVCDEETFDDLLIFLETLTDLEDPARCQSQKTVVLCH